MATSTQPIDELIENLFDHPNFLSRLRTFYEIDCVDLSAMKQSKSIRTDASSSHLQASINKCSLDCEPIVQEIQELLCELYAKSAKECRFVEEPNIDQVLDEIARVRKEIASVQDHFRLEIGQVRKISLEQGERQGKFITLEQHLNWQQEILQKLDIAVKRNTKQVQSIFADRLNSFEMNLVAKSALNGQIASSNLDKSIVQYQQAHNGNKEKEKLKQLITPVRCSKKAEQEQISTLKKARSFGNLLGFKS